MRGGVAEWPKVRHGKCRVGATLRWVRIPPPPPLIWLRVVREIPQSTPIGEKGPVARRRPKAAGEAYPLYVEPAAEGANGANGPLSAIGTLPELAVLDREVARPSNPQS